MTFSRFRSRLPNRSVGMLVVLMVCGVAVAAGVAATTGGSSQIAKFPTDGHQVFGYQLASDAQGASTIVWSTSRFVGDFADSLIRVSDQNAQGKWSTPVQVGGLHQSLNPVLAESDTGAAVIAWSWVHGGVHQKSELEAVTRSSADAAWSVPQIIWSTHHVDNAIASVGIDSAGSATLIWTGYRSRQQAIWARGIDTTNGTMTRVRRLIPANVGGTDVTLTVNGAGAALLSWQRQVGLIQHKPHLPTVHAAEMAAYRTASGKWLVPHELARFSYQEEPEGTEVWGPIAPSSTMTANGTAATTWQAGATGDGAPLKISTRNPITGDWSARHTLESRQAFEPTVTDGPANSVLALWSSSDQGRYLTSTSENGVKWSAAQPLGAAGDASSLFVTSDANGNHATVAIGGQRSRILLTTRTTSGWSDPREVGTGLNPEVDVSPNGSTTVVWEQAETGALKARTYH